MRRIVTSLTLALVMAAVPLAAQAPGKRKPTATAPVSRSMRITGNPSSLASCTTGNGYTTHALGASVRGTRITVDIEGGDGFDGIATGVVVQMGSAAGDNARVQYAYSDDTNGTLDPQLNITLENDANVVVLVGSYSGDPGCYFLKVDVRLP
jgi:hypothetical protein